MLKTLIFHSFFYPIFLETHPKDLNRSVYSFKQHKKLLKLESIISSDNNAKEHPSGTLFIEWNPLTSRSTILVTRIGIN